MKSLIPLCSVFIILFSSCVARDLILGTAQNARLVWQHKAEYASIPFMKRVKEVFYADPSQQLLRGIIVRDIDNTEGEVIITAGGLGFSYVNLRLKSARGDGLNYQVDIYV